MTLIDSNINTLYALCEKHKVKHLYVFGSVLTEKFNNDSDIDLIVDFDSINLDSYFDNYFEFKYSLQQIFQRSVDLLEEKAIKNPYFRKTVNENKELIYG